MFIKTQAQNSEQSPAHLPEEIVAKHQDRKLVDALSLYVESIKVDEAQSAWIYGNAITLSAQTNNFDLGMKLKAKAERLYSGNDEICRAIALLYEKQNKSAKAIEFYQKSLELNSVQPEWVYLQLIEHLTQAQSLTEAEEIRKKGLIQFPQSTNFRPDFVARNNINRVDIVEQLKTNNSSIRSTPRSIEHNVDLNVASIRQQLMDSSIVEQYEILLEQMLCHSNGETKEMNTDALVRCLAEIKTDIHYLKTKLLDPPTADVDPQAKQSVDIKQIVSSTPPVPIKCQLKNRIVGSGWHAAEEHGRWMGEGTISSIVLPYPCEGKYRLEIIVRAEAKAGLLNTLKINFDDHPLPISQNLQNTQFPTVIQEEIAVTEDNQSFLSIDLIIDETVNPAASDARLIGLLIESINLIPLD